MSSFKFRTQVPFSIEHPFPLVDATTRKAGFPTRIMSTNRQPRATDTRCSEGPIAEYRLLEYPINRASDIESLFAVRMVAQA